MVVGYSRERERERRRERSHLVEMWECGDWKRRGKGRVRGLRREMGEGEWRNERWSDGDGWGEGEGRRGKGQRGEGDR